ncbi:hypothetical protein GN956_G26028 [Arapaima gigas]
MGGGSPGNAGFVFVAVPLNSNDNNRLIGIAAVETGPLTDGQHGGVLREVRHRVTCSFLKKTFIRSRETPVVRRVCSVLMSHRKEAQKGGRGPRAARRP